MTDIVSEEIALDEFDRFAEAMDLDTNTGRMDDEDRGQFEKQKWRLVDAIRCGSLVITDNGEAEYTPRKSDYNQPIRFHERTGASAMASDGAKKGRDVAKSYAIMADMTETQPRVFARLRGIDIKVCEAIFALLMD